MKKIFIVANLILFYSLHLSAQDYKIKLINNTIQSEDPKTTKQLKSSDFDDIGNYFIIQFENIPNEQIKKQLIESGIELIEYVPEYAYLAKKLQKNVKISSKSDIGIKRIEEFKPEYKFDYRIYKNDIPKWAVPELGKLKVSVEFFEEDGIESEILTKLGIIEAKKIGTGLYELIISESKLYELAEFDQVKWIELIKPERQLHNKNLRTSHRVNVVNSDLPIGKGLYGEGIIIGEVDGGEAYLHDDLLTNIKVHTNIGYSDHATHVAGTIIGKGLIDPEIKGMAPNASLHLWDFYVDNPMLETDSAIYEENLNLVTNSWGFAYSPYNCYSPVPYGVYDREYDKIAKKYPKVLQMFSAGNDREFCSGGYKTAGWNMKNVLFVGAVDNNDKLAFFSSCGPLYDGRIIPHIVGMGVDVYSTELNNKYVTMSGTSMSTPGVTGSIALLYESYYKKFNDYPTSSLAKALVCNTAKDLGNPGPDYQYGFGRIDILKAIESVENGSFIEGKIGNQDIVEHTLHVNDPASELKITLVYSDLPAYTGAAVALVDNLDIEVVLPDGTIVYPLVLNPEQPAGNAIQGKDNFNNIEQIIVKSPQVGDYIIKVRGVKVQSGCDYSIAYQAEQNDLKLIFPIGNEKLITGKDEYIRWNSTNNVDQIDLYISNDNGINWTEVLVGLSAQIRNFKFTVPDNIYSNTNKIKIVQGESSYESESFTITPVSKSITFNPAFESTLIKWDKVPNADSYNVFSVKEGKLELLQTVTDTFYTAQDLETNKVSYFTIQSYNLGKVISQRNVAKPVVAIPQIDLGIKSVVNPLSGDLLGEEEEITIRLINKGANEIVSGTEIALEYILNGAEPFKDTMVFSESLLPDETIDYTFSKKVYMAIQKYYKLELQVNHPEDTVFVGNNKFAYDILHFGEITEYPYKETFDKVSDLSLNNIFDHIYLGRGWENDYLNDDFEWWPWNSDTYKDGTGPSSDHTSGKGKFLYTESFFLEGESGVMNLSSPNFNVNSLTQPFISFWYHMFAESMKMGTLYLDVYCANEDMWYENIWSKSGSQGDQWKNTLIDISEFKNKGLLKFRFRVVTSTNYQNAVAIDDFELYEGNIYDLKIDSVGINEDGGLLTNEEIIKIYYSNIGGKDIQAGEKIKFIYEINDDVYVAEEFVVSENIVSGNNLVYEFTTKAVLGDITRRNFMAFEIYFLKDNKKDNNIIRYYTLQSYNEPQSACEVAYYYLGVLNFNFNGVYPETSIENFNTQCANTEISGYSFYGDQLATVYKGKVYEMGVQPIYYTLIEGLNPVGQYVKVWIDYDQNGRFELDEQIYEMDHRGIAYDIEKVVIPEDAVLGLTRLRVRTSYYKSDLQGEDAAHRDYELGETEDYTIEIKEKPSINVGLTSFVNNPHTFSSLKSNELLSIRLTNLGLTDINSNSTFKFSCSVNGDIITENYTNQEPIKKDGFIDYDFTKSFDLSKQGKYCIKAWVDFENDLDPFNDTIYLDVINLNEVSGIDYSEDFEDTENAEWFATAKKNKTVWEQGKPGTKYLNMSHSGDACWVTVLDSNYFARNEAILYSPLFDFTGTESVSVSFWISTHSEPGYDGLILETSYDGLSWDKVGENQYGFYNTQYLGSADMGINFWSDYSQGWRKKEIDLNNLCNKKVVFRFRFYSDENQEFEGVALDDFVITATKTTTGTEELLNDSHFTVYPNPFSESVYVRCNDFSGKVWIKILDLNGKTVREIPAENTAEPVYINLSDLKPGIYIIQCVNKDSVYNHQIIKY